MARTLSGKQPQWHHHLHEQDIAGRKVTSVGVPGRPMFRKQDKREWWRLIRAEQSEA